MINTEKKLKYYTINDSMMFAAVMQNPEICKKFLERILPGKKIRDIKLHLDDSHAVTSEKTIVINPIVKSIRMDVLFEGDDEWYNIELQMSYKPDQPLRGRYYDSSMTVMQLKVGDDYTNLKTNYVIFINPFDFYGKGKAVYMFYNMEEEYGKDLPYGDRTYKIVVCTSNFEDADTPELKALLQYLNNGSVESEDSFVDEIDTLVHKLNQPDSEWRERRMTIEEFIKDSIKEGIEEGIKVELETAKKEALAEGIAEGRAEGIAEGRAEGIAEGRAEGIEEGREEGLKIKALEGAKNLKAAGVDLQTIANAMDLTLEEVENL